MTQESHEQAPTEGATSPRISQNFRTRILTATVLLPIGIYGAVEGGIVWTLMMSVLAVVGVLEFIYLARGRESHGNALIAIPITLFVIAGFHRDQSELWIAALIIGLALAFGLAMRTHGRGRQALAQTAMTAIGVLYVGFPLAFLVAIRAPEEGFLWLVVVLTITWGTDTFAYFGGRAWGKHLLAPTLSPKKTVEGAVTGVICGIGLALLFLAADGELRLETLVMVSVAAPMAVLGDLLESAIKRYYDVKDSHVPGLNVIPGHGGVLDRVDSLLVVATVCYVYMTLFGIAG